MLQPPPVMSLPSIPVPSGASPLSCPSCRHLPFQAPTVLFAVCLALIAVLSSVLLLSSMMLEYQRNLLSVYEAARPGSVVYR